MNTIQINHISVRRTFFNYCSRTLSGSKKLDLWKIWDAKLARYHTFPDYGHGNDPHKHVILFKHGGQHIFVTSKLLYNSYRYLLAFFLDQSSIRVVQLAGPREPCKLPKAMVGPQFARIETFLRSTL